MILFVFEGKKREPLLFKTLAYLFFQKNEPHIVCSFGNNIYELYKRLIDLDDAGDIVSILREILKNKPENPLKEFSKSSDFSEIYLFFDYDFHNQNLPLPTINHQLREMLDFFQNETENGKLYINYPMIESIRYTKKLPDANYRNYTIDREKCRHFKDAVQNFSDYGNLDFILLDNRIFDGKKHIAENGKTRICQNWQYLKEQNTSKANYICNGEYSFPRNKESIMQQTIFEKQCQMYVNNHCIAILNAFPLFLYDYF